MPRIPDKTALGQAGSLRSGREYLTAADVDTSAKFKGLKNLGTAIAGMGAALDKKADEDNALDIMKAETAFKRESNYIDNDLSNNTDFEKHNEIYSQRQTEAADKAATLIRDEKARQRWRLRADLETENGRLRVMRRANIGSKETRIGDLDTLLTENQNIFSSPDATPEQRDQALRDIETNISLAERSGVVSPSGARTLREKYQRGAVLADVERRTIEDPEGLLKDLERGRGAEIKPAGQLTAGNINLDRRPELKNDDGSISTLRSMSVNIDGKEVLIPTVTPDGTVLSSEDAIELYKKTGQHLGMFDTPENATNFAKTLSQKQGLKIAANQAIRANISVRLETGKTDPLKGVANISPDSKGSKSYGNFGLNSLGSAQEFIEEYGEALGLTGEPGTAAFDKSWKAVARADPEGLHEAEMRWYADHISSHVSNRLKGIGVPDVFADDPRVQAYFADRSVQQGEGSIGMRKHADRINEASAKAGSDPVRFLREMTELDREALYEDFPSALKSGRYSPRGHDNRIDQRLSMSINLGGRDSYSVLSPLERAAYIQKAKGAVKSQAESSRNQYKQMLDDDIESVRKTGNGVDNFDLEGAKGVLDKSQISKWEVDRTQAQMEYDGLHDLNSLTNDELSTRLRDLEPRGGEAGFAMQDKVYRKASREIGQIRKTRLSDPARSVDEFPEVRDALTRAEASPGDPTAVQNVIRARLDAQTKIGIPAGAQSPIPLDEARVIAGQVKGLQGKELYAAIAPLQQQLQQTYGPYARAVSDAAIETIVRDKELAKNMTRQMERAFKGQPISGAQVREHEIFNEGRNAMSAFSGDNLGSPFAQYSLSGPRTREGFGGERPGDASPFTVGPMTNYTGDPSQMGIPGVPQRAINDLIRNPALAPVFDSKYGKGAAATILAMQGLTETPPGWTEQEGFK